MRLSLNQINEELREEQIEEFEQEKEWQQMEEEGVGYTRFDSEEQSEEEQRNVKEYLWSGILKKAKKTGVLEVELNGKSQMADVIDIGLNLAVCRIPEEFGCRVVSFDWISKETYIYAKDIIKAIEDLRGVYYEEGSVLFEFKNIAIDLEIENMEEEKYPKVSLADTLPDETFENF